MCTINKVLFGDLTSDKLLLNHETDIRIVNVSQGVTDVCPYNTSRLFVV